MKFKRISEKQIQCLISQEELIEKGIAIDDFLDHRDKTEEFLREVVDEAQDALDIEEMGHFFSVQMHILKTGNVSLIINLEGDEGHNSVMDEIIESAESLGKFKDKYGQEAFDDLSNTVIKDLVDMLMKSASLDDDDDNGDEPEVDGHAYNAAQTYGDDSDLLYDVDNPETGSVDPYAQLPEPLRKFIKGDNATDSNEGQKSDKSTKRAANQDNDETPDEILGGKSVFVRMETLDDCIRMSKALKDVKCNYSKLYKYDEEYYIEIAFINDSKFVAGQIMTISEYAEEIFTFDEGGALIAEHGKQIISENAVAVLAKL